MEDIINKLDAQIEKVNFHGVFSIFGMGDLGYQFVRNTKFFEQIKCVYDNDMGKRGTTITRGSKTIGIEQPRGEIHVKDNECILITSYADKEIAKQIIGKWISIPYLLQLMEVQEVISTKSIEACMIESTNYCNATCEFCCNGTMKREKCHMSMEIFNTIVKRLKEEKILPKKFTLHCCGEPLLDPNLFYKIDILKRKFPKSQIKFTSNFSIADSKMIEKLLDSQLDSITISLNTISAQQYHKIMRLDYQRTLRNVEELLRRQVERQSNIEITLSIIQNKENHDAVIEFVEFWKDKGVNVRIMKEGQWVEKKHVSVTSKENSVYNHPSNNSCPMLSKEICILSNGDYALCCFDAEGSIGQNVMMCDIDKSLNIKIRDYILNGNAEKYMDLCGQCSFNL